MLIMPDFSNKKPVEFLSFDLLLPGLLSLFQLQKQYHSIQLNVDPLSEGLMIGKTHFIL